jgi:hypothetical protein
VLLAIDGAAAAAHDDFVVFFLGNIVTHQDL